MKEGEFRIPSGCAIAALIHKDKHRENGERITQAMRMMHERSNGLGGGFAAYGIYPEHKNEYARMHVKRICLIIGTSYMKKKYPPNHIPKSRTPR